MSTINVLKFGATWCPPCRALDPIITEIKQEYDSKPEKGVVVSLIDVDEDSVSTVKYKISSIPVIVFEIDGKEISRIVGLQNKSQIVQTIQKLAREANLPE